MLLMHGVHFVPTPIAAGIHPIQLGAIAPPDAIHALHKETAAEIVNVTRINNIVKEYYCILLQPE